LHPPCRLRIAESPTDRAEKAGSRRHDLHAPGTRPLSGGYSDMETSSEYRRFAQECHRLAGEAKTERHRKIMQEMAQAWERLAKETDGEGAHASP
jgi:hypothetical protein